MGFFGALFGMLQLNADPAQQQLARMLVEVAESQDPKKFADIADWLVKQPWSASEIRNRIAHAVSITRISSVPATHARVKELGMMLHSVSYR
jgi:hypothetical protein